MIITTKKIIRLTETEEIDLRKAADIIYNLHDEYDYYSNTKGERLNTLYHGLLNLINDIDEGDFDMEVYSDGKN